MEFGDVTGWAALFLSFIVFGERIWARMKDQTEEKLQALDVKLEQKVSNIEESFGSKIEDLTSHKDRLHGANVLRRLEDCEKRQRESETLMSGMDQKLQMLLESISEMKAMMRSIPRQ